ncbi:MAG TPA: CoA transferase subunit A [Chitinophagaceae bacterium]|nr:CoA transferase subunit A [Chitinophagaceae bacterium]
MSLSKVVAHADEAVKDIQDGMTLMLGGFGLCGIPENCIAALVRKGVRNLTCISNNAGVDDFGIGLMLQTKQVKKMISSYVGENEEFERQLLSGELEVELIPQGTLATRCMATGYGMPVIYTPAGVGTEVAEGKETRRFSMYGEEKVYLMEKAFESDYAIVKAWKGDHHGNLIYKATARNFNPMMAMAGRITIAEVEELVEPGEKGLFGKLGLGRLGDAKVNDLGHGATVLLGDEDVVRLEVAVNDAFLVRVLDGLANLDEQPQPRFGVELVGVAVIGDALALDQFHHEVGAACVRCAAVEHAGDVRMVHQRQRLALGLEAGHDFLRVHAQLEDLQRDLAAHRLRLLRHPDGAEAAFADRFQQLVAANQRARLLDGN